MSNRASIFWSVVKAYTESLIEEYLFEKFIGTDVLRIPADKFQKMNYVQNMLPKLSNVFQISLLKSFMLFPKFGYFCYWPGGTTRSENRKCELFF